AYAYSLTHLPALTLPPFTQAMPSDAVSSCEAVSNCMKCANNKTVHANHASYYIAFEIEKTRQLSDPTSDPGVGALKAPITGVDRFERPPAAFMQKQCQSIMNGYLLDHLILIRVLHA